MTKPTKRAQITVPSRTPMSRRKYSRDTAVEITTMEQSNTVLAAPRDRPDFWEMARLMPSPGVGMMLGARYSMTPTATRGMLHSR